MILKQELPLVAQICRLASCLNITKFQLYGNTPKPFKIVDRNGSIYTSTKLEIRWYTYLLFVVISCIQYWHKETVVLEETVLFLLSIAMHFGFLGNLYVNETKSKEITLYINSIYQFESTYRNIFPKNSKSLKSFQIKMSVFMIQCGIITIIALPIFFVYALHWGNPCKATLVGFGLISECRVDEGGFLNQMMPNVVLKTFVFLVNHWMWSFAMNGTSFGIFVITTLTIICIYEFIDK